MLLLKFTNYLHVTPGQFVAPKEQFAQKSLLGLLETGASRGEDHWQSRCPSAPARPYAKSFDIYEQGPCGLGGGSTLKPLQTTNSRGASAGRPAVLPGPEVCSPHTGTYWVADESSKSTTEDLGESYSALTLTAADTVIVLDSAKLCSKHVIFIFPESPKGSIMYIHTLIHQYP